MDPQYGQGRLIADLRWSSRGPDDWHPLRSTGRVCFRFPIRPAVWWWAILVCCLLVPPASRADETDAPYDKTELYFGPVDDDDWSAFLARDVTPRFPQGLTWYDVQGQWQDARGVIRKLHSRLLILIYIHSPAANKGIEAIRSEFKARFHQQSVLRVTEKVDASF